MRALVLLLVLGACTPSPPSPSPPVMPDASDADTPVSPSCAAACAVMSSPAIHCPGITSRCPRTMANLEHDRLLRTPDGGATSCACVAAAKTPADVTACGVGCGP